MKKPWIDWDDVRGDAGYKARRVTWLINELTRAMDRGEITDWPRPTEDKDADLPVHDDYDLVLYNAILGDYWKYRDEIAVGQLSDCSDHAHAIVYALDRPITQLSRSLWAMIIDGILREDRVNYLKWRDDLLKAVMNLEARQPKESREYNIILCWEPN